MKILFISHDAYRAGAQILALHFLEWLKTHRKEVHIDVLLIEGGVLKPRFEQLSNKLYDYSSFKKYANTFKEKIWHIISQKKTKSFLFKELKCKNYDLIYANSVVSLNLGIQLKKDLNCKLLLHVHELESVIQERVPNFSEMVKEVNVFVAASQMVKNNLIKNHTIGTEYIEVIYEFSKIDKLVSLTKKDNNQFIVGGSGSMSYRKGFDLFLKTALHIKKEYSNYNIRFMWVGGGYNDKLIAESEVEEAGLKDCVFFTGEQENPSIYFKDFDIFLLTSREDPFPLVCIEAAQLSKPIICFEGTTGSEEVLRHGGGCLVPNMDIEIMGQKIIEYYNDRILIEKDGDIAKTLFSKFTPEEICPQLYNVIASIID